MTARRVWAALVAAAAGAFIVWLVHTDGLVLAPLVGIAAATAISVLLLVDRDEREQRVLDALNRSEPLPIIDAAGFARAATARQLADRVGMSEREVDRHLRRRATHDSRVWLAEIDPHRTTREERERASLAWEPVTERFWVIQHMSVAEALHKEENAWP